jgi:hypothetical protein
VAPYFKRPGVPVFKSTGIPGHNNLCCCYEDPAIPCGNCNASQTPNGIEIIIEAADVSDHTCGGICSSLAGTYILTKVEDADCYYSYCEDDPCNTVNPYTGGSCKLKLLFLISDTQIAQLFMQFCSPGDVPCNSLGDGVRIASWTHPSAGPDFVWDCLDDLDWDMGPDANDGNIDIGFCHAGIGSVHARALN